MALMARGEDRARPVHRRGALRVRLQLHGAVDPGLREARLHVADRTGSRLTGSTPNNLYPTGDGELHPHHGHGRQPVPPPGRGHGPARSRRGSALRHGAGAQSQRRSARRDHRRLDSGAAARPSIERDARSGPACRRRASSRSRTSSTIRTTRRARSIVAAPGRRSRQPSPWPASCRACRTRRAAVRHAGRAVGEDTRAVLARLLGYDGEKIADLAALGRDRMRQPEPDGRARPRPMTPEAKPHAGLVQELERRRGEALAMGGPEKLARRRAAGVLNARERDRQAARSRHLHRVGPVRHLELAPEDRDRTPADGKIAGFGKHRRPRRAPSSPTTSP